MKGWCSAAQYIDNIAKQQVSYIRHMLKVSYGEIKKPTHEESALAGRRDEYVSGVQAFRADDQAILISVEPIAGAKDDTGELDGDVGVAKILLDGL